MCMYLASRIHEYSGVAGVGATKSMRAERLLDGALIGACPDGALSPAVAAVPWAAAVRLLAIAWS